MVVSAIRRGPIGISDNCRSAGGEQGGFLDLVKSDNSDNFYPLFGFVKFFDGNFEKELVCLRSVYFVLIRRRLLHI